ncbi:tyrosinase family oxidase copper chaperone [Streptomyces sp. NRRL F-5123]|uniref:tyrosinase family oxidase copper chaperone n=1 Tax=Streptomyces sp. NRRL F-5123 TaxID=1463856 RepID=UPI0006938CF0|nr:tyrosinase family oxidase copper chaperone [Streptomyces sp. NRRL F-5123]
MSESDAGRNAGRKSARTAVTRRRVITSGVTSAAAVAGTVAALHPLLTAGQPAGPAGAVAVGGPAGSDGSGGDVEVQPALFDEVYRGRRIQGFTDPGEDGVAITVDGEALPVMRRVDGSWISTANHYQPYTTPLATARAAVDVIGRAKLSAAFAQLHHH